MRNLILATVCTVLFPSLARGIEASVRDPSDPTTLSHSLHISSQEFFGRPGGAALLNRSVELTTRIIAAGRCRVDVCFALDGSRSLTSVEYQQQKEFAALTSLVLSTDKGARFAGVQYGSPNIGISRLTNNATLFVRRVAASQFAGANRTFISAGLLFCTTQLRGGTENMEKIVLFGDGMINFGLDPREMADRFHRGGGAILAVGVGKEDQRFLSQITQSRDAIVSIGNQTDLPNVLTKAVEFLCEL